MFRPRTSRFLIFPFILAAIAALASGQSVSSPTLSSTPSRQFGQNPNAGPLNQPLVSFAPNLVEGREFNDPYSIAFDTSNPASPILYVADTVNNRVLAFKNPARLTACGISAPTCGVADLVIGQNSMYATLQNGLNRQGNLTTGFTIPTSVAVDSSGNLYVADSGNNRILRFPQPFSPTQTSPAQPDLVIGQKAFSANTINQGNSTPSQTSLNLNGAPAGIAIDPQGALWIADTGNNRVLRFPASQLAPFTVLPAADVALGQNGFTTGIFTNGTNQPAQLVKNILESPFSIAFDSQGRLYVSDVLDRVLFFVPSFSTGISAQRVLGIYEPGVNPTGLPAINQYQLGSSTNGAYTSVFTNGTNLFVVDSFNNRIVEYGTPDTWPTAPTPGQSPQLAQDSPPMLTGSVIGQLDFNSGKANKGQPEPDATTFSFRGGAAGAAFLGTMMWVADAGNNRVLGLQPTSAGTFIQATQLAGQVDYPYSQPNLIEGRELFITASINGNNVPGGGTAVDLSAGSSAPHLYIADTFNNRILGFKDARNVQPGQKADLVIGQTDLTGQPGTQFYRGLINNPNNDPQLPTQFGLNQPSGVAVDSHGNLWVADTGNGRVLRFPAPFSFSLGTNPIIPNLVLGQQNFNVTIPSVSQNGMTDPFGLAVFSDGSLAVSEPAINRILIFKKPANGDFANFQTAAVVLGQAGFNNSTASNAKSGFSSPVQMGVDSSDRLYVADFGNARMSVFTSPQQTNQTANFTLALPGNPEGVAVSGSNQTNAGIGQGTGEIFLTFSNGQVWKLFEIDALQALNANQAPYEQVIQLQAGALAPALDSSSNLIVSDTSDRMVFYYPQLNWQHGASFNSNPIAPGQFTYLTRVGLPFSFNGDFVAANYPWPTVANDLKVTVAGTDAHIFSVINEGPYIAFQMPTNAPSSGTADILVTHPSTGEIVGVVTAQVASYNPGFFTQDQTGNGQVAALNGVDNTENSSANAVARGSGTATIIFCLTGGGVFDGGGDAPPADGMPYTGSVGAKTHILPQMINTSFGQNAQAPSSLIVYSGAGKPGQGCNFPGGWQITWTVSSVIPPPPSAPPSISLLMNSIPPAGPNGTNVHTTFQVK